MPARFCHNCGKPLPENAKFCAGCGCPVPVLPAAPAPAPEVIPEPVPAPAAAERPVEAPAAPAPSAVFTLDALDTPAAPPAKPVIFSLDALTEDPVPEPAPEPKQEPAPELQQSPEPPAAPVDPEPVPPATKTAPPAKKEKPSKKKPSRKQAAPKEKRGWPSRSGGRTVLAVLLCVVLFIWSFACLTLVNVRLATTGQKGQDTLAAVIRGLDLTQLDASVLTDDLQNPNTSLADWIAGKITENYQGRVDLDPADLKEFWEDSSFPDFLVSHLGECIADLYTGSSTAQITAEEIQTLLQTDAAVIDEIFDEQLSEADIAHIADAAVESGVLELLSAGALKQSLGGLSAVLQFGLSWWVIGIAAVILVLLVLLLGKINGSALRTFGDTGITLMVMSAIWCIGGLLILMMPDLWNALFHQLRPLGAAIGSLLTAGLLPSAIAFGVGVLLLLVKIIGKSIVIKSAKVQA